MDEQEREAQARRLLQKLCKEATRTVRRFSMIEAGDRILVGVSGGEDSLTLMHVLTRLQRRAPFHFDLFAVTVDMGYGGFDIESLAAYCHRQNWPWEEVSLPGERLLREKAAEERPCSLCSRLRRGQLHAAADRLSCNKIALGQQADDLCVSLLMALFRGGGLKTMGANVAADSGRKRLIRPLCMTAKSTIHEYALLMDYPSVRSCPYQGQLQEHGDRHCLEQLLKQLEPRFRDIRGAMLHSMGDVRLAHLLDERYLNTSDPDSGKL